MLTTEFVGGTYFLENEPFRDLCRQAWETLSQATKLHIIKVGTLGFRISFCLESSLLLTSGCTLEILPDTP